MFATKAKLSSNKEYNTSYTFTHNVYVHVLYKVGLNLFFSWSDKNCKICFKFPNLFIFSISMKKYLHYVQCYANTVSCSMTRVDKPSRLDGWLLPIILFLFHTGGAFFAKASFQYETDLFI